MRFLVIFFALATTSTAQVINFDSAQPGTLPPGWTQAMTHNGGAPKWEVLKDNSAPSKPNVLAQTSNDPTDGRFPLAILDKANVKDGELSVKFKPISGRVDQGAGIVWHRWNTLLKSRRSFHPPDRSLCPRSHPSGSACRSPPHSPGCISLPAGF